MLRTGPTWLSILRDLEELCPREIVMNYTNPMSALTLLALRATRLRVDMPGASWREVLLDLKRRGLKTGPKLAVGDGTLGFLGGTPRGLTRVSGATMLGAQDYERAGQDGQERAGQGQGDAPRDVADRPTKKQEIGNDLPRFSPCTREAAHSVMKS